jgi:hypothetical protein
MMGRLSQEPGMPQISTRERIAVRAAVTVAILFILWALGLFQPSPPVLD